MFFRLVASAGLLVGLNTIATAETRSVFVEDGQGQRMEIATLDLSDDGTYALTMKQDAFSDHFLSMRPFKCLEGPEKTWCHVPYPYENKRNISDELTDLEYDLLFIWKRSNDYGIDMWNGVYYKLSENGAKITGSLHEMDMNVLSVPPVAGNLRPVREVDLTEGDVDSHWLPFLVIE